MKKLAKLSLNYHQICPLSFLLFYGYRFMINGLVAFLTFLCLNVGLGGGKHYENGISLETKVKKYIFYLNNENKIFVQT